MSSEEQAKTVQYLDSRYAKSVGQAYISIIEDEDLDDYEIKEDIKEIKQSTIIQQVSEKCGIELEEFGKALQLFLIPEKENIANLQQGSKLNVLPGQTGQSSKQNIFGMETSNVLNIDWTGHTNDDIKEAKEYINKQCGNAIVDQALITIETIGRRHNLNLVPLLHDIFSFYRFRDLSNPERYKMTHSQFCAKSKALQSLKYKDNAHKEIYTAIVQTLASFQHRLTPVFRLNNPLKIDDNINPYIQYTLAVSNMLKKVLDTQQSSPIPLSVDLWIIPLKVKEALLSNADDSDEDSDEEDSDSDDEEKEDTMTTDFTPNLLKYGASFEVATLENNGDSTKDQRTLETVFKKILNQHRRSIKLNIIIDRRKKKDNLLIYELPLKYSAISRNYCNETLIFSTANYIMFDIDNSILKRDNKKLREIQQKSSSEESPGESYIFGAKYGCDGKMFLVSFGLQENQTRMTFWKNGGGVRFWPQYMTQMWPRLFINPQINKLYTKEYIANNFGLDYKDEQFAEWYKAIVDFDK